MKTWSQHKPQTAGREAAVITDAFTTAAMHLAETGGTITTTIEHALKAAIKTPIRYAAKQADDITLGRQAEREGRAVIYIHGRPYADPAHQQNPQDF